MNDYKELLKTLRALCSDKDYEPCEYNLQAADAIEELVKERDAAVADLKSVLASERGLNQCYYCKYREKDGQCYHDCIPCSEKWGWEWRGVQDE